MQNDPNEMLLVSRADLQFCVDAIAKQAQVTSQLRVAA